MPVHPLLDLCASQHVAVELDKFTSTSVSYSSLCLVCRICRFVNKNK